MIRPRDQVRDMDELSGLQYSDWTGSPRLNWLSICEGIPYSMPISRPLNCTLTSCASGMQRLRTLCARACVHC